MLTTTGAKTAIRLSVVRTGIHICRSAVVYNDKTCICFETKTLTFFSLQRNDRTEFNYIVTDTFHMPSFYFSLTQHHVLNIGKQVPPIRFPEYPWSLLKSDIVQIYGVFPQ